MAGPTRTMHRSPQRWAPWPLPLGARALVLMLCSSAVAAQQATTDPPRAGQVGQPIEQASAQDAAAAAEPAAVVNINEATAEELVRLPGIGPAKAAAIIAVRQRIKRFPRLAAIMRVPGIGRRTFARLRPMLVLDGPTTLLAPVSPARRPQPLDSPAS